MGQVFAVSTHDEGRRLDKIIRKRWPDLPLGLLMREFRKGHVKVNGRRADFKDKMQTDWQVSVPWDDEPRGPKAAPAGHGGDIEILYADGQVCIVNKPAGVLSQPDTAGGESVISMAAAALRWKDATFSPTPVHRLDRNTSGVLVLALDGQSLRALNRAWREDDVSKQYIALVSGDAPIAGDVELSLEKDRTNNMVRVVSGGGDYALTRYRKMEGDGEISLLHVELLTGRPHQARVHLASTGHPVLGDLKYGDPEINHKWRQRGVSRPMLHCRTIAFKDLPEPLKHLSGKHFTAIPPRDFLDVIKSRGWRLYGRGV